jgi:1-deoxy-D-xylulose-5-phosphate reductoisomerase
MVQFDDGGVIAQLGTPDMRLPIQYALYYPDRKPLSGDRLDFAALKSITFEAPDMEVFKGLALAFEAGRCGGSMTTAYNAANEKAVSLFLNRQIGYTQITELIEGAMNRHKVIVSPDVAQILSVEQENRKSDVSNKSFLIVVKFGCLLYDKITIFWRNIHS